MPGKWKTLSERTQDREQALEKKKQLSASLIVPKSRPVVSDAATTVEPEVELPNAGSVEAYIHDQEQSYLSLSLSSAWSSLALSAGLKDLVKQYLRVAQTKEAVLNLTWPGMIGTVALLHALATTSRWIDGHKKGFRTVLYPTKANSLYRLDHLYFNADELLRLANEFYEPAGADSNRLVKQSLRDKDPFLFFLGSLRNQVKAGDLHPCINELLPHFQVGEFEHEIPNYGRNFFEHLLGRLRDRSYKKALQQTCDLIGDPARAPDALFAVNYKVPTQIFRDRLKFIARYGHPDVVLIDATRRGRRALSNWRRQIPAFIDATAQVFATNRVGVLVITEDPRCIAAIKYQLAKNQERKNRDHRAPPTHLAVHATNWPWSADGLSQDNTQAAVAPEPRRYRVRVTDSVMSSVIQRLNRIAREPALSQDQAKPLRAAADFLTRLSALPCGVNTLAGWLSDRQFVAQAREHFTWPAYRAGLTEFASLPEAAPVRSELEEIITDVGKIWDAIGNATPLAHLLLEELDQASSSSKRITVVFTRAVYKTLADRFVQGWLFPSGKRFEEFSGRIRFVRSDALLASLDEGWSTRYVFAGIDDESLRLLVVDNRIAADSAILLSHQSAIYLKSALEPLGAFDAFRVYRPRIEGLLTQIKSAPGFSSVPLAAEDFIQPSFSFGPAIGGIDAEEINPAEAWTIELEDGRKLIRRGSARILIYEPQHPDAGASGFRSAVVSDLHEEHKLFLMSEELREHVEDELKKAGVELGHDRPFEVVLREYHSKVMAQVNRFFKAGSLEGQVRLLRERIERQNPALDDLPKSIRNWVNLGKNVDLPFEELMPQAPRKFAHFQAFAKALELSDAEVSYYWGAVINPIRSNRIRDGRYVSDIYAKSLFDPAEAMVYHKVARPILNKLYEKALDNVFEVCRVIPPVPFRSGSA
jgi:hypothetical protein